MGLEHELNVWLSLMRDFVIISVGAPFVIKKLKSINIAVLIIVLIVTDLTIIVMEPKAAIYLV